MSPTENPQRNAYFGELHVHTAWSLDAFVLASLNGPDEAFRYAKGEIASRSSLNNAEENRLRRPLDFAAVTEHAEWLGEYGLVVDPTYSPAGDEARARVERYRATQVPGADGRAGDVHSMVEVVISGMVRPDPTRLEVGASEEEVLDGGPDDLATDRRDRRQPQRPRPVHDAQRLRVDAHSRRRQLPPGDHLPRQRRPRPAA